MEDARFWEDPEAAKEVIAESNSLSFWTTPAKALKRRLEAVRDLLPDVLMSCDEGLEQEFFQELQKIEKELGELEIRKMLSGELDRNSCYLSINAGAGGTEACDWAEMLARMYQRWIARRHWKAELIDTVPGEVAGIKSITLKIIGDYAFGFSKAEKGVHRLVRVSPFDSSNRRHTSFASVDVTPEIAEDIRVEIKPEEVRVDTFRASGAGGQHVNVTDSAVRLTHLPTGITVSCQSERSQIQNKETCFKMLRSKLYELEVIEREKKLKAIGGEKKEIAWGSQIRNYVYHPYTLVKDTRTKVESSDVHAVMDGDIDFFICAYLKEFG